MKLSIIIVNYNVQFFLENCLNSVIDSIKGIEAEVFVVDNNSVDGSVEMVKTKFPSVKCIANNENLGFSKANNQAIKLAKGEYILLLNPDTVLEENTLKTCCDFLDSHPDGGGLGVKMLDGKGNFLPESKRGLPRPSVAFYKIFGLSTLFPKSKRFSQYHLGHLSKDKNHEVDVLSGAFMMLRKSVLDQIGLLDENFFMYGEDIDLSYRITQANYKNYYLADTSIIHYKGESTKKSSINYVFVFYRAMAIFAKKHFSSKNAKTFGTLINLAIYLRASLAVLTRTIKHILLPILDSLILYLGISTFKAYYEVKVKFKAGGSYPEEVEIWGIPIMISIYLLFNLLNGSYAIPTRFINILKGVFTGSLVLLISYSLLDETYRFSRAIVLFTVIWSLFAIPSLRFLLSLVKIRPIRKDKVQRIALIGKKDELERITTFLKDTLIHPELICYINSDNKPDGFKYLAKLNHLKDIIDIYSINEVIFCAKDISASEIIKQMSSIENDAVDFKIAPPESIYIIGSNSIESSGEYYIIDANVILKPLNQRNKRLLDIVLASFFLLSFPLWLIINGFRFKLFKNLFSILQGKLSFVGFIHSKELEEQDLKLKRGLFNPRDLYPNELSEIKRSERLNFDYGKNYSLLKDLEIILKNSNKLAR